MTDLYIYDIIDDYALHNVMAQVRDIPEDEQINVRINSPGGYIQYGLGIYNVLKRKNCMVYIEGVAFSMASVIAMAGKKIYMSTGSMLMIHDPLVGIFGNSEALKKEAEILDKFQSMLIDIYQERSGLEKEEIKALMNTETYLLPDEAIEKGFADEKVQSMALAANFDFERLGFKKIPKEALNMADENEKKAVDDVEKTVETQPKTTAPEVEQTEEVKTETETKVEPEETTEEAAEVKTESFTKEQVDKMINQALEAEAKRIADIKAQAVDGQGELVEKLISSKVSVQDAVNELFTDLKLKIQTGEISNKKESVSLSEFENAAPEPFKNEEHPRNGIEQMKNSKTPLEKFTAFKKNRDEVIAVLK